MLASVTLHNRSKENASTTDQGSGRSNICSSFCLKLKQAVSWCFSLSRSSITHASELRVPLLPLEEGRTVASSRCLKITAVLSATGITTSAALFASVVNEVANRCFDAEMQSQEAFNQCDAPYGARVIAYSSILSLSSCLMGYVLRKLCEQYRSEQNDTSSSTCIQVKEKIALIESRYRYEILLGVLYLYNGISINVSDTASFKSFLNCGIAGMSFFFALVGMYARQQRVNFQRKDWLKDETSSFNRNSLRKIGGLTLCSATVLILTFVPIDFPTAHSVEIIKALSTMILCRPLGHVIAYWVDRNRGDLYRGIQGRTIFILSAGLSLRSPLILAGYSVYLISGSLSSQLVGMSILGFTQGVNDFRHTISELVSRILDSPVGSNRVWHIIKNYWPTAGLIIFATTLEKFRFLDCQGAPTPLNYTCPLGFELSGYLFQNQLVVESRGVNLVIIAGVTQYYVRMVFRMIQNQTGYIQKITRQYLHLTDRYQFDLLSILPYAIIQSRDSVYSDFYSHNPAVPLVILGITFGTYKEHVDAIQSS